MSEPILIPIMNTDETAHKVLSMPNDAQFTLLREFPNIGKTAQGFGNTRMVADLQRMAKFWLMREEIENAVTDCLMLERDTYPASAVADSDTANLLKRIAEVENGEV